MEWLVNFLQSISPQSPPRVGGPAPISGVSPRGDLPTTPSPAPAPTTVPGAQTIPRPTLRPTDGLMGMLFGPSASPSQEGMWYSPSQGPGAAVTQPDPAVVKPKMMDAVQMPQSNNSTSAPAAPAPPAPNRMAPGQLMALLGGQNPLAAQESPQLQLLSRLLGGR